MCNIDVIFVIIKRLIKYLFLLIYKLWLHQLFADDFVLLKVLKVNYKSPKTESGFDTIAVGLTAVS